MNERILIIDDERAILKMLTALLESEGYAVVKASDGVEGLELFFKVNPALVITDVKMHKKGGLAVLKEIKASGSDVDVIILTGRSDEATAID